MGDEMSRTLVMKCYENENTNDANILFFVTSNYVLYYMKVMKMVHEKWLWQSSAIMQNMRH